jgi:hypothetical protein
VFAASVKARKNAWAGEFPVIPGHRLLKKRYAREKKV